MENPQSDQLFLVKLLSVLALSKTALRNHRPQISPEFWSSSPVLKAVAQVMLELYDKIQAPPTKATLLLEMGKRDLKPFDVYADIVRQVYASSVKEAANYYEDQLVHILRVAAYQNAIDRSLELFKTGEFEEIDKLWIRASSVTYSEPVVDTDLDDDQLDAELADDKAAYDRKKIVPTGYLSYDKHLRGGIASGELHLVVAPPNSGKSRYMLNVGTNAAVGGYKVLYVTLEMAAGVVRDRYYQCLTNSTVDDIRTETGRMLVKTALGAVRDRGGCLHIKKFDEYSISFRQLTSFVRAQSTDYDLLITDYMDLFAMETRLSGNYFVDQGIMYMEGRRMAHQLDVGHLSACQPVDGHGQIIALRAASGGKGKGAAVDAMMSLNANEAEEVQGKQTAFLGKNRIGPRQVAWSLSVNRDTGVVTESRGSEGQMAVSEGNYGEQVA